MKALTPDHTILGLLAAKPRHGYDLLDCFQHAGELGRVWHMSTSQIYAVLRRLEQQGWIMGREFVPENAPPRTEYYLTPQGQAQLTEWLDEQNPSASIRRIRVEFLSRLFVAQQLGISSASIIQRQQAACQHQLMALIDEREHVGSDMDRLALELHIAQVEAVLTWIERCKLVQQT